MMRARQNTIFSQIVPRESGVIVTVHKDIRLTYILEPL